MEDLGHGFKQGKAMLRYAERIFKKTLIAIQV